MRLLKISAQRLAILASVIFVLVCAVFVIFFFRYQGNKNRELGLFQSVAPRGFYWQTDWEGHITELWFLHDTRPFSEWSHNLGRLPRLRSLRIPNMSFGSPEEIAVIAKIPNLSYLDVSHTNLSDEGFYSFLKMPRLKKLDVSYSDVSFKAVSWAVRNKRDTETLWIPKAD